MKATLKKKHTSKKQAPVGLSYEKFKEYQGREYTGMAVGRSHKWYYDQGEWKETKITPDEWEISYSVTKRRAGKAPEGSGVPVGTGYHWFICAHQVVEKLDADDYSTSMSGFKFKVAHHRKGKGKWSATPATQRRAIIGYLKKLIIQLQQDPIPLQFTYKDEKFSGEALPVMASCLNGECTQWEITLNGVHSGIIRKMKSGWKLHHAKDQKFVNAIGKSILAFFA
jgi:hypothetical protein